MCIMRFFSLQSDLCLEINDKVCIFIKNWHKRSEKSPNLPLKMDRQSQNFPFFNKNFPFLSQNSIVGASGNFGFPLFAGDFAKYN